MSVRRFAQVDVFTARAGYGNALAVVLDGDGLDETSMQRFAAWTNLSESAFVLKPTRPGADFRVRIFTPRQELPFAGHPTVGATHALLEAGRFADAQTLNLECAAGVLPVRIERGEGAPLISIRAPQPKLMDSDAALIAPLADALGASPKRTPAPRIVDVGAIWLIAELDDARTVRALAPSMAAIAEITAHAGDAVGIAVFGREAAGDAAIAVRAFCPADGIPEDPVTGSANAAIGAYLRAAGSLASIGRRYRASQGREVGRDGFIDVDVDPDSGSVTIGGTSVTLIEGTLRFGPDA
jgi:PhzF family phenazine biosynthesis protein